MRVCQVWSSKSALSFLKSATLSLKASSKGNSSFIALLVISLTLFPLPDMSANSSRHSCSIMVESMSATKSFFFLMPLGCITRSIPKSLRVDQVMSKSEGNESTKNSAATPSQRHLISCPVHLEPNSLTRDDSRFALLGLAIREIIYFTHLS